MDKHNFMVSIVTPEGIVYEYPTATLVVLNTTNGKQGVMANHIPFVAPLCVDELQVVDSVNDFKKIIPLMGIFAEFSDNKLTVIGDSNGHQK